MATDIRLLPHGSVQLEQISNELYVGTIEKPLPAKAPNKVMNEVNTTVTILGLPLRACAKCQSHF